MTLTITQASSVLNNTITQTTATLTLNISTGGSETAATVKTKYESNADTNAFTDAEKTLLGNQSGTNTGDQVIPVSGVDFDSVGTDNSDNNAVNTLYSGLAASKQDNITLTTTGSSGAATLIGATLNIPQYAGGATGADGSPNPNITVVTSLAELQAAATNAHISIQATIDCGAAAIDVSTKNFTLYDGGGLITNFTSFNIGNFHTEGNPNATYFNQSYSTTSGTARQEPTTVIVSVIGQCLDEIIYVNWFSPNKNADLISGGTLNGALPDHVAIQNAIAVTPTSGGIISFPSNSWLMQGDGTNADYPYTNTPYTGIDVGGIITVSPNSGTDDYLGVHQAFSFYQYDNLSILGNGSTILANPNQTCIVNNAGWAFIECDNVYIENLTYNGNVVQRDTYLGDSNPFNRQHAFTFNGCMNPILKRVIATDSVMDGFYFGANSSGIGAGYGGSMTDCKATYNYRQGMSIVSHSAIKFYNCEFSYTGRRISTVGTADGRYLTTSPSAGVDMEAGGSATAPNVRGQYDCLFDGCTFEENYGAGLAVHWGSTRTTVRNCVFINDTLFEPQDTVEETTGNNNYINNTFLNGEVELKSGGCHFIGNIFYIDDFHYTQYLYAPPIKQNYSGSLTVIYGTGGSYYDSGYHRQSLIKNNLWKVEATSSNFPVEIDGDWVGVTLAKVTVNVTEAIFEGNRIINALGIKDDDTDNTIVSLGNLVAVNKIHDNTWIMTTEALAKYAGNVGRMYFGYNEFTENEIYSGYSYNNIYYGGSRGTTTELNALTTTGGFDSIYEGAEFYDTTTHTMKYYNGTSWIAY